MTTESDDSLSKRRNTPVPPSRGRVAAHSLQSSGGHSSEARKLRRRTPNKLQLQKFVSELSDHPHRALILTLTLTGMRISDTLKWEDLDFERHTLKNNASLKKPGPSQSWLKDNLLHQDEKLSIGSDWNPHELVFPTEIGTAIARGNFHECGNPWSRRLEFPTSIFTVFDTRLGPCLCRATFILNFE